MIERKPRGYWQKWENVEYELKTIIEQLGHFPVQNELRDLSKNRLAQVLPLYFGGVNNVRKKLGYEPIKEDDGHWEDWNNIKSKLLEVIGKLGHFPTQRELVNLELSTVASAANLHHGNLNNVRRKMGYDIPENDKKYWESWENLEAELKSVISKLGHFPTENELRELGFNGLSIAITRNHGGVAQVRMKMGYEIRKVKPGYWEDSENRLKEGEIVLKEHPELKNRFPSTTRLQELGYNRLSRALERYEKIKKYRSRLAERMGMPLPTKKDPISLLESLLEDDEQIGEEK